MSHNIIRQFIIITLLIMTTLISACSGDGKPKEVAQKFEIHRGLNTSHWLSQTEIRGEERAEYMQERDFAKIAEMGFDHVRIPIDEEQMWDEQGLKHLEAFRLLHQGIEWAFQYDLKVIVDLHVLRSHHFNYDNDQLWKDPEAQAKFWGFWEQLSEELSKYPNHLLAYELMNEAVADDSEDWNKLIAKGIETVRQREPLRTIVIGSNRWQMVYTFPELKIPENDTNLILSFHFYEPFIISHYQVWWNALKDFDGAIQYPGLIADSSDFSKYPLATQEILREQNGIYNKEIMTKKISVAIDYAKKRNLKLYCGEFGCYPSTSLELRKLIYRDWIAMFEENNIAWTHWNYKNDFPVVDAVTLEAISPITDILIQKK